MNEHNKLTKVQQVETGAKWKIILHLCEMQQWCDSISNCDTLKLNDMCPNLNR